MTVRNNDYLQAASNQAMAPGNSIETGQFVALGFGPQEHRRVVLRGTLDSRGTSITQSENDDAIPFANPTHLTAGNTVVASGTIGDGEHGSSGTNTGDFDFYAITANAGETLTVSVETDEPRRGSGLDTTLALYDSTGTLQTVSDDQGFIRIPISDSQFTFTIPTTGDYFVAVGGFPSTPAFPFPGDPLRPGTGAGAGVEGDYDLNISLAAAPPSLTPTENDDAIPFANETGLALGERVRFSGFIGDGAHGSSGTGTGDFDYYAIDARAGETITVDIDTEFNSGLNTLLNLYDSGGTLLAYNNDDGDSSGADSFLSFTPDRTGTYFVSVHDVRSVFGDLFEPGNGQGAGGEAAYDITFGLEPSADRDFYNIDLNPGDILSASVTGRATELTLLDSAGNQLLRTRRDQAGTGDYPAGSPLNQETSSTNLAYVIERAGTYSISAQQGTGDYELELEVLRPFLEQAEPGTVQTLFLDFDGATLNPRDVFRRGVDGDVELSPLSAFLPNWGLTAADEDAVIDAIVATVTEKLKTDIRQSGDNPNFDIEILNSRDHADILHQYIYS